MFYIDRFQSNQSLLIVFCSLLFFGGTSKKSEAYEYFMKGEYELLQNDFKMAEKYYKKSISPIIEKIKDSAIAKIVTLDGTIIGNESILGDLI